MPLSRAAVIIGNTLETVMRVYLHLRREDVSAPDLDLDAPTREDDSPGEAARLQVAQLSRR